jgi:hypothetical protein
VVLSFLALLDKFEWQAPDEEFEEFLRLQVGEQCPGDENEVTFIPILLSCNECTNSFCGSDEISYIVYIFLNIDGEVARGYNRIVAS